MRQLSAFHADVSCAQPGALDCNRFGELVLDIFGEEVLVTRAKDIMGVVVIMVYAVIELDIAQSFGVIRVMEYGIRNAHHLTCLQCTINSGLSKHSLHFSSSITLSSGSRAQSIGEVGGS